MIFNGKRSLAPKQIIKQIFTRLLSILLHFFRTEGMKYRFGIENSLAYNDAIQYYVCIFLLSNFFLYIIYCSCLFMFAFI